MKVKDLIVALSELNPNSEVLLQRDPEGNGYSPIQGVDGNAIYIKESGDVYDASWSADEACHSPEEWKKLLRRKRAVILYPSY